MKIKQSALAAAITAALAMGVAGQASASVYARSILEISNLVVGISPAAIRQNRQSGFVLIVPSTLVVGIALERSPRRLLVEP